ncbi:MAG TPA: TraR/DksA family transcriptional regulator [Burkholderiales bacterium]|nr:TraR/DksA family transcriptional regulator [Burkholderiales bacterium]
MAPLSRKLLDALDEREQAVRDKIAERRDALDGVARPPDPAGDVADKAFGRSRAEVEHDLIEISMRELADIAAARQRVENGTYGECIECGEPIAPARLEVKPTARRCAQCQARHEKVSSAP